MSVIDLPAAWWPDRTPDTGYVLADADDLLSALVAHADAQGRFYGDPELMAGLFWRQDPPLALVTACLYDLLDRDDISMYYAVGGYSGEARPVAVIQHRQRFTRWRGRQWVPAALRRAVMERDGRACCECGSTEALTIDHIIPYSHGGPETLENLRVLCKSCNSRKGDRI